MAAPSYTYTLSNGTTADASQVMQNFNDILNGVTDGTKDLSINALTCAGAVTLNGNLTIGNASADTLTVNASLSSSVPIGTNNSYDIGSATLGLAGLYLGAPSSRSTRLRAHQSLGASNTLVFPNGNGSASQWMVTDGSGNLSFTSTTTTGKTIDGSADEVQLTVQGHSTQTNDLFLVEKSDGTDLLRVVNSGGTILGGPIQTSSGSAASPSHSFSGDENTGFFRDVADQVGVACAGSEVARFSASSLEMPIPILTSGGDASSPAHSFSGDTDTGMYRIAANRLGFTAGGSNKLEVNSTQVNIGSDAFANVAGYQLYSKAAANIIGIATSGTTGTINLVDFRDGANTQCGKIDIDADANTASYGTSSDERLKTNIQEFDGISILNELSPVQYERISNPGVVEYGFLAQQLYKTLPQAVVPGGEDADKNPWVVDYSKVVAVLCRAIKDLKSEIDSLKQQLNS